MVVEAQNKEFFINNPNNIHFSPLNQENKNGEYAIISDEYLLGIYKNRIRAMEVYEDIKKQILRRKKYYLMPKE